jgi:hypothetical protein
MDYDRQWLEQCSLRKAHTVRELVAIPGIVCNETSNGPTNWADTRELNFFAEIVLASFAEEAFVARHTRLNRYSVTSLQVGHLGSSGEDNTWWLVTEHAWAIDFDGSDAALMPEVHVGAALYSTVSLWEPTDNPHNQRTYTGASNMNQHFVGRWRWHFCFTQLDLVLCIDM